MGERPILFSAPMVRALLDGRKTQTRRLVTGKMAQVVADRMAGVPFDPIVSRYGVQGDRLWVREAWGYRGSHWNGGRPNELELHIHYRADDTRRSVTLPVPCGERPAGLPKQRCGKNCDRDPGAGHGDELTDYWRSWRPSIHMPRWASRITLEVTDVRIERARDISEADAIAEGCVAVGRMARENFAALWCSINGEESWQANPWVWAVSFRPAPTPHPPTAVQPDPGESA